MQGGLLVSPCNKLDYPQLCQPYPHLGLICILKQVRAGAANARTVPDFSSYSEDSQANPKFLFTLPAPSPGAVMAGLWARTVRSGFTWLYLGVTILTQLMESHF